MGHKTLFVFEAVNNMGMRRRCLTRAGTRFGSGAGDGRGRHGVSFGSFFCLLFLFLIDQRLPAGRNARVCVLMPGKE